MLKPGSRDQIAAQSAPAQCTAQGCGAHFCWVARQCFCSRWCHEVSTNAVAMKGLKHTSNQLLSLLLALAASTPGVAASIAKKLSCDV